MKRIWIPTAAELGARDPQGCSVVADGALARELAALLAEQSRREGGSSAGDALQALDGARHPDLQARFAAELDAALARSGREPLPPLKVKVGDTVLLAGLRCTVVAVDARDNTIRVAHEHQGGSWEVPIDGTGIPSVDDASSAPTAVAAGLSAEEPVEPSLERATAAGAGSSADWQRYAQWLSGQGDPRGALIAETSVRPWSRRVGLAGSDVASALLRTHWSRWMGAQDPERLEMLWHHGFLRELCIRGLVGGDAGFAALLAQRSLHHLRVLELGAEVECSLRGLELLPALERLAIARTRIGALRTMPVRHPGRLRVLELVAGDPLADLLPVLAQLPWLHRLDAIRLGPVTPGDVSAVLAQRKALALPGSALTVTVDEPALEAAWSTLRAALPDARLQPVAPTGQRFTFHVADAPQRAPRDFRSRPAFERISSSNCADGCCPCASWAGAGVPFAEAEKLLHTRYALRRCMACASPETRVIHATSTRSYDRSDYETVCGEEVELECLTCAKFSRYTLSWSS